MPVGSAGTVQSVSPDSQTRLAVGASRAYPSAETHNTSSAPRPVAQRCEAMFTAYDRDLTPPSNHGAGVRASAAKPSVAVTTAIPARRAWIATGLTGASVANTVTGPPDSGPRVQTSRSAPSTSAGHSAHACPARSASSAAGGSGRSIRAAERAIRARCSSSSQGRPRRTCIVSKTPSPRSTPRSSAVSTGVSAGTTPLPGIATIRAGVTG